MNSKVTLYYDTKLHHNKNFIVDDIISYLATKTSTVVNDVQYQRFDLFKRLKLNLSQAFQGNLYDVHKWDYCEIRTSDGESDSIYYYFINGYRQVAQSTIELDLEMDVLNTFRYDTDGVLETERNKVYTLSPKSLITREHKDRIFKKTFEFSQEFTAGSINQSYTPSPFDTTFWSMQSSSEYEELVGARIINYSIQLFPDHGTSSGMYITRLGLQVSSTGRLSFIVGGSGQYQQTYIRAQIQITYQSTKLIRKIDTYQEGIETYLFKQSERELLDDDKYNTYYLFYSTLNNVVSDEDATSPKYVNPIKMQICTDNEITFTSSTSSLISIYANDQRIPQVKNRKEALVIKKSQLTGEAYLLIGGTRYDESNFPSGKDIIVIIRDKNTSPTFSNVDFADMGKNLSGEDVLESPTSIATNVDGIGFYGINEIECWVGLTIYYVSGNLFSGANFSQNIYIGSGSSGTSATISSWKDRNLASPKLIKVINYPYSLNSWMVGKSIFTSYPTNYSLNVTDNILELVNPQKNDFDRNIYFNAVNPISIYEVKTNYQDGEERNDVFESKIYHSDYYQAKFVYDSYGFTYQMENIDINKYFENFTLDKFIVRYVVSGNVLSKFMFQFVQYVTFRSTQDYENVLIIDRNNEKALYNNAYLNYIKSGGYSYDTKKANSQNAMNGITTALSVLGAVASYGVGVATNNPIGIASGIAFTISTASSIIRNIHSAQEQDKAISQKLLQISNQATQVQGSEDIDILKAFSNNKAKMVYYEPNDVMKKAILDLFYYCGYATHEQKVPDPKTRRYFNFIQGEIILDHYTFNEDVAEKIKDKWKEGVTFIHRLNYYWDVDQVKENIEMSIF